MLSYTFQISDKSHIRWFCHVTKMSQESLRTNLDDNTPWGRRPNIRYEPGGVTTSSSLVCSSLVAEPAQLPEIAVNLHGALVCLLIPWPNLMETIAKLLRPKFWYIATSFICPIHNLQNINLLNTTLIKVTPRKRCLPTRPLRKWKLCVWLTKYSIKRLVCVNI